MDRPLQASQIYGQASMEDIVYGQIITAIADISAASGRAKAALPALTHKQLSNDSVT